MRCRVDDIKRDQMRHVTGNGQHHVVMFGAHDLNIGAEFLPKRLQLRNGGRIRSWLRRQNAPSAIEQFCKAGFRSRLLGTRNRMTRNEMHALRQMRSDIAHDCGFDRTNVGDNRASFQVRRDLPGDFAVDTNRRTQDHEVRAFDGLCRRRVGRFHEAQLFGFRTCCGRCRRSNDFARQTTTPHCMTD